MKKKISNLLLSTILILIGIPALAEVVLTDAEYKIILQRLKSDKYIIDVNNKRWGELKKTKPKIEYNIQKDYSVIQNIEIPIYASDPLKYEVKFQVDIDSQKASFFPMTFFLFGTLESTYSFSNEEKLKVYPDAKIGVQLFSLKPLMRNFNIGLNVVTGIRSAGISISYTLPKYLKNTSIHAYLGINYASVIDGGPKKAYGLGISLNF